MFETIPWNTEVTFGIKGNYRKWAGDGWGEPEPDFTWIEGVQATLEFDIPPAQSDPILSLTAMPLKSDKPQQMFVYLNGRFVALFLGNKSDDNYVANIDNDYFKGVGARNTLTFCCPRAVIPAEMGIGRDLRTLSFAFVRLSLGTSASSRGTRFPAVSAKLSRA